jgi:hypothetical protein
VTWRSRGELRVGDGGEGGEVAVGARAASRKMVRCMTGRWSPPRREHLLKPDKGNRQRRCAPTPARNLAGRGTEEEMAGRE